MQLSVVDNKSHKAFKDSGSGIGVYTFIVSDVAESNPA